MGHGGRSVAQGEVRGEMDTAQAAADEHRGDRLRPAQAPEDLLMPDVRAPRQTPRLFVHGRGHNAIDLARQCELRRRLYPAM